MIFETEDRSKKVKRVSIGSKEVGTKLFQKAFLLQASKLLDLPGLAMQLQAPFPDALFLLLYGLLTIHAVLFLVKNRDVAKQYPRYFP